MNILRIISGGLLLVAMAGAEGGGCESPASFKKCLAQTRAEVNICGINMTCKCMRQENVIRCYEKCGEDKYYKRLKKGEKGQQQIFCSQKQPGEPEDLPIIGSEGGSVSEPKKPADGGKAKKNEPPPNAPAQQPPTPPDDKAAGPKAGTGDHRYQEIASGGRDRSGSGASIVNAKDMDIDGAAAGVTAGSSYFTLMALSLTIVLYAL
ncbi:hypothetical protein H4R20_002152 [Coemansia guatemalensis]|uniref:Extracellular membrane protein CFEM domain-containing protein n=1 Tax=Coemansia guatemalensis TaxID=2761395 RepID=A0A9W8HY58_9FUNG|nr:hypothetical protein H4R20_002152 [Coemansia guatemalensis]